MGTRLGSRRSLAFSQSENFPLKPSESSMNPAKEMRKKSFSRDFEALSSMIWDEREKEERSAGWSRSREENERVRLTCRVLSSRSIEALIRKSMISSRRFVTASPKSHVSKENGELDVASRPGGLNEIETHKRR